MQAVVVVDAGAINTVLGQAESLSKVLEMVSDQLLSQRPGHPTLFSSATKSPWWKLVRKGTAPAFVQKNIRSAPLHTPGVQLALLCTYAFADPGNICSGQAHAAATLASAGGAVKL